MTLEPVGPDTWRPGHGVYGYQVRHFLCLRGLTHQVWAVEASFLEERLGGE